MTRELTMVIGISGSGKSTYLNNIVQQQEEDGWTTVIISRDAIRFSMLKDGQDYFANEKAVFNEFIRQINEAMALGIDWVYVDATHLNEASRKKVLSRLKPDPSTMLNFTEIQCPVEVALERNATRKGLTRVPDNVILNMEKNKTDPMNDTHPNNKYGFGDIFYTKIIYEGE